MSRTYEPTPLLHMWVWHAGLEAWIPKIIRDRSGRAYTVTAS